jgi:diacylglycerol kinase (ATP)
MQKVKTKLIVNPNADLGRAWRLASDMRHIADEFGGADWSGTVYPTHAIELAQQAGDAGYEMVIAVGGDGTVHEIVNGLMQLPEDRRPRLGVVPMGSGNDFAKAVGIETSPYDALRKVFTGKPRRIDIGRMIDDRGRIEYWDNTLGLGFDATVTIRSRKLTYLRGFVMYFTAVLQTIILNHEAANLTFQSDQESWEERMLMLVVCNGPREGGGFMVAPEARPDDGIFHYAAVRKVSRPMMLRLLPEVMNGTHGRFRQVRMGQCKNLTVESDIPFILHTDGEIIYGFGTHVRKLTIEILPQALEVIV